MATDSTLGRAPTRSTIPSTKRRLPGHFVQVRHGAERQEIAAVEPRVGRGQAGKARQEQPCAHEQDQGQRHLSAEQHALQPSTRSRGPTLQAGRRAVQEARQPREGPRRR